MREFVFTIEYERGVDEVMDLFMENPELHARTTAVHATSESMWRLDHVTGSKEVLEAFDDLLGRVTRDNQTTGMCGSPLVEWDYEILSSSQTHRLVYTSQKEGTGVHSIPHVAAKHIGDGLLMQAERRGNQYQWRLLMDDEETVGAIYDEVERGLCDGLSINVQRLSEPECGIDNGVREDELPPKQQAALEAAAEHGYYETPRRNSLQSIADMIDVPTSTLQYRITRAEAWLATEFVSGSLGAQPDDQREPEDIPLESEGAA
ncbi:helix-turn-helix domain-containing protein [Halobacterium jilantaiense]|uniref:HTH DNA binding domain-containing protein n=1 Tax=Halobacterium jilantaiense TaxID=355548 RepID=A0A1I0MXK2_9EURY|nr:helix-turn-helix domain-containing protein [Halobacterium jilantaiense]SEV93143.1 HTH DNA binding domain-containing protein [Halobacterium jilantaiense]